LADTPLGALNASKKLLAGHPAVLLLKTETV
jgi:hypothetical protein